MLRRCLWLLVVLAGPLFQADVAESSFHLPAPQNVTIVSYNFQSTLKWSPVMGINNSAVSYRVEYCTAPPCTDWREVNKPEYYKPAYDFTNDIKIFVAVTFRVRAEQGELKSDWVDTSSFRAEDQTILGPPREISVTAEANSLIVSYEPPFDHNPSYSAFKYNITYWEKSTKKDLPPFDKMVVDITERTEYRLANLKEMTEYCLRIQAIFRRNVHLLGHLSDTYCKKTSRTDSIVLWLALALTFAVVSVSVFFFFRILYKYQNILKSLWLPPLKIPSHYEEDLENPQMTVEEFQNCAGEDQWDSVSVISSMEQNPTVPKNTDDSNQEVQLLETEELR